MTSPSGNLLSQAIKAWLLSNQGKKPTITDVAAIAEVSKKTVSRVTNHPESVKLATRKMIETVMQGINYQPDAQARGLAFRHALLIGVIYDNPNPQYTVNVQQGILDGLKDTDYELLVHPSDRNQPDFVEKARCFIIRQKLRGVILTPSISEDEHMVSMLEEIGCDYVRIASVKLNDEKHTLVSNDHVGGTLVARHLCELGHTRLAFVTGKKGFRSSQERLRGFESGLSEYEITLQARYIAQGKYTFESGLDAGHKLLALSPLPTAIFAANDEMAAGVLQAIQIQGLRVPNDISVVGFDDFQIAMNVWPRLSTVHSPTREIGKLAVQHLLTSGENQLSAPQSIPWMIERESSGPAGKTK